MTTECYFVNDGNGTFAVPSLRVLMEMIEDWDDEAAFGDMDEDEWLDWLEAHHYRVSCVDLVWHGPDRAVWDTSFLADPRAGAGHERYAVTSWPLGATWGDDVDWVYSTAWPRHDDDDTPSAEAVLRLIRMLGRKRRQQ